LTGVGLSGETPDVVGYPLQRAASVLRRAGYSIVTRFTTAPRGTVPEGERRVVRQRVVGPGAVELVVAAAGRPGSAGEGPAAGGTPDGRGSS